jgi:hypothetical protein
MTFAVQVAARQKPKSQLVYSYFPGTSATRWMDS